jgi:hypothetical protein
MIEEFVRGDTPWFKFVFTDEDGAAVDITNYDVWLTFKRSKAQTDLEADLQISTTAGDEAEDNVSGGIMYLKVDKTSSEALTGDVKYWYDVQVVTGASNGYVKTIFGPTLIPVHKDITSSTS